MSWSSLPHNLRSFGRNFHSTEEFANITEQWNQKHKYTFPLALSNCKAPPIILNIIIIFMAYCRPSRALRDDCGMSWNCSQQFKIKTSEMSFTRTTIPTTILRWSTSCNELNWLFRNAIGFTQKRPTDTAQAAASLQSCCCFCCCRWGCSAILLLLLPPASPIRAFVITLVRHQPNTVLLLQITPTHGQSHQKKAKPSWYWCGEMNYTLQRSTNITFVYSWNTRTTRQRLY